jgi:hypothetical protein
MSTVSSGNIITAAQFNTIQSNVALALGTGTADLGYGQTVTSSQIAIGKTVTAADLTALQTDINKMRQHQTGSAFTSASLPTMSGMVTATNFNLYDSSATTVVNNRLTASSGNMTLTSGAASSTRASVWGTSATPSIVCAFSFAFGSANAARFFFNTGGELRLTIAHPSTATVQDANWNNILGALGTITLKAQSSSRSGTGGTPSGLGYYSLTTTYTSILDGTNIGTGAYAANDVAVDAGINAGGDTVLLRVTLSDQHTNTFYDQVASGTVATVSYLKSTVVCTGITSPTVTVSTAF